MSLTTDTDTTPTVTTTERGLLMLMLMPRLSAPAALLLGRCCRPAATGPCQTTVAVGG